MNEAALSSAATISRGLSIDAIHACSSGHLGLPLGCAEIGAVLFGKTLQYQPSAPKWINRDRFILSAGHGSMFLYSWLHLAGYDLPLEEVKNFRQLGSHTPGHPENFETPGVEATTGPLGQGIGNAVGYALSAKMAAKKWNTPEHSILDYHVFALAGDGCLQEGVAREAIAFAGHNKLDNLILLYDANEVTLDAMADRTQGEDTKALFEAMGWEVQEVDGHNLKAVDHALEQAKSNQGKAQLIICKTVIGQGIPEVAGTQKAHGEGGAKFAEQARKNLGLPEETFYVSPEVSDFFASHQQELQQSYDSWQETFTQWSNANPELAEELSLALSGESPSDLLDSITEFDPEKAVATRAAGGVVINELAARIPNLITGSADLYGSTKNYIKDAGDFGPEELDGKNIWFGIREHAMGAICNGIAYDGFWRASAATFAVFADYLRPSIRLAALAQLPVTYILTHDSVGVGEDGPTHQPVETCSGLRVIPNLDVIRPCDAEETVGAWIAAQTRSEGPTALLLTRQGVPNQTGISATARREGVLRGAYVLQQEQGELELILLATGSEVQHAIAAANQLGKGVRVVSMPCMERFARQSAEYQESVLPDSCSKRVAIEAGVSDLWWRWVGSKGAVVGIDRFGISAPGNVVMQELGMTAENLVEVAQTLS